MSQKIISHFGIRIHKFIIEFCENFLDIEPNIESFEFFRKALTQEQRILLLKKMKIYQLQMFAIKNSIWSKLAIYIVKNKLESRCSFQGLCVKKNEKFTYNSNKYKMTKFRIILQEYLIETNKI
jgi:hypothetical protein